MTTIAPTAALFALALSSPTTALVSGAYTVQHDAVDVVPSLWDVGCGPPPTMAVDPRGTSVTITVDEAKKRFAIDGASRHLGTTRCEGENPSLAVVAAFVEHGKHVLRCRSQRVVRGTEETEHTIERLADGRVKIAARFERRARVRRYDCRVTLERHTILAPVVAEKPFSAPGSEAAPPPAMDERALEAALDAELKRVVDEAALARLSIVHDHALSSDFKLLEARYVLDGKELSDRGRAWPMLASAERRTVLTDVVTPGVHALEVELVYLTQVNGAPARLRAKNAAIFDVREDGRTELVVKGSETGGPLTPVEKRARLEFFVDGRPLAR